MSKTPIPIIDLFAGPGGLGEGFSAYEKAPGKSAFKIRLSIEMDEHAHKTLRLRSFVRQFPRGDAPDEYYDYVRGKVTIDQLHNAWPKEAAAADHESWQATLGETDPKEVSRRITAALGPDTKEWLLIGGPPCQAYSLVGRSRMIGKIGRVEFEKDHRHFLYREYLRIIAQHQPAAFVMENVKGLLSATVGGQKMFNRIIEDLTDPIAAVPEVGRGLTLKSLGYNLYSVSTASDLAGGFAPGDFIVRAEDYEIPQARHRIIILGIRSDISRTAGILEKKPRVAIDEVIGDLPRLRSGLSKEKDTAEAWRNVVRETVDFHWAKNGDLSRELRESLLRSSHRVSANLTRGGSFIEGMTIPAKHDKWFFDKRLNGVCNHETRSHIRADLHRYFFAAVFAKTQGRSPLLQDLPKALLPEHENVAAALKETKFNDRFRVQSAGRPSTTVVSHISKDGHYYIHYDPSQCRSLTVREAARLQTFPDNYFFEGPRTEQYQQVGNAVPPLLAHKIAKIVATLFN